MKKQIKKQELKRENRRLAHTSIFMYGQFANTFFKEENKINVLYNLKGIENAKRN